MFRWIEISPLLRNAVIAVEDHRFYQHGGVDPIGILRALFRDVRSGGKVQGGSTITQQLARMLFLSNERTWDRKFKEVILAEMIEAQLTKDQVLELYLNRVYLSAGVYGVENMSRDSSASLPGRSRWRKRPSSPDCSARLRLSRHGRTPMALWPAATWSSRA